MGKTVNVPVQRSTLWVMGKAVLCAAAVSGAGAAVIAAGCGYSTGSSLDPAYRTIHIATIQNQSREYDLQAPLTNAVIRKFLNDTRLRVVDRSQADLLIEGVILDYQLRGLIFDRDDEVTQFITIITAGIRLSESRTGRVLWEDSAMSGETTYSTRSAGASSDRARGNAAVFLSSVRSFQSEEENQAASEALEQLASDIFYRTIEPW